MLVQRSFEDLGTPLSEVTFCVVDLETTGGSPTQAGITEVGAVKVRCGEVTGTFQTLVDPGEPVPAFIRLLTGISDEMLIEAPETEAVLPSLLEFIGDSVIVAHNARFDVGFINAALTQAGYEKLSNRVVDTARLAAKIFHGEVPNNRLDTLARYLRCAHKPCHRAFADVLATVDLLHHLIERVAGYGVTTLEDLLAISSTRIDGTFHKISLCEGLPARAGVYRFIGAQGQTLYVGKAADLRSRVRSYFYGDPRRKIRDLLRQTEAIRIEEHTNMLAAEVAEARAIASELPPHNRAGKKKASWYVKVIADASVPKVATARVLKQDASVYLGPFSMRTARTLIDALRDALPLHRCADPARCNGCAFSEMARCPGGRTQGQREAVRRAAVTVTKDPSDVLDALVIRMQHLGAMGRFEEAAEVRDRGALLERTLFRSIEVAALRSAGQIELQVGPDLVTVRDGALIDGRNQDLKGDGEARVIAGWIRRQGDQARLRSVSGTWAMPVAAAPSRRFASVSR